MKYPTRRSFIEMQQRSDFKDKHVHKEAGMEITFVIGCQPMEIDTSRLEKESSSWDDVEHPPDDEDGVLHVSTSSSERGRRADGGLPRCGLRRRTGTRRANRRVVRGRDDVGDGRTWDQVRFNEFPSSRQFMKVVADPRRLKGHEDHRDPAMADTYTLLCARARHPAQTLNRRTVMSGFSYALGFGRAQPPIG